MANYTFVTPAQADSQGPDLSDQGVEQAVNIGALLKDTAFSLVLTEPSGAATMTASFASGLNPEIEIREVREFSTDTTPVREQGLALAALRDRLGSVPLRKFRSENPILMRDFSLEAALAIHRAIDETGATEVLIVAENIIIQALGLMLAPENSISRIEEALLDLVLGECEGFTIKEDGKFILHRQPE